MEQTKWDIYSVFNDLTINTDFEVIDKVFDYG